MLTRKSLTLVACLMLAGAANAAEDPPGCAGGGGQDGIDALGNYLEALPNCESAMKAMDGCWWGSRADNHFGRVIVDKCEKQFLGNLSPDAQQNYRDRIELCNYRYSQQEGTLYQSAAAMCRSKIAAAYVTDMVSVNQPLGRASFDCAKASTPFEETICSVKKLGQADHVLSQTYGDALGSFEDKGSADRKALVASQKAWLKEVENGCGFNEKPQREGADMCALSLFEARFTALDSCGTAGISAECVDQGKEDQFRAAGATP